MAKGESLIVSRYHAIMSMSRVSVSTDSMWLEGEGSRGSHNMESTCSGCAGEDNSGSHGNVCGDDSIGSLLMPPLTGSSSSINSCIADIHRVASVTTSGICNNDLIRFNSMQFQLNRLIRSHIYYKIHTHTFFMGSEINMVGIIDVDDV